MANKDTGDGHATLGGKRSGAGGGGSANVTSPDGWIAVGGGSPTTLTLGPNAATLLGLQPSNNVAITGGSISGTTITLPGVPNGLLTATAGVINALTNFSLSVDDVNKRIAINIDATTIGAAFRAQFKRDGNIANKVYVNNPNAGALAYAGFQAGQNDDQTGALSGFLMYGSGYTPSGAVGPNVAEFFLQGGSANMAFDISQAAGDFTWNTTLAQVERMRLSNAGLLLMGLAANVVAAAHATFKRNINSGQIIYLENPNAGGAAFMSYEMGTADNEASIIAGTALFGSGYTTSGNIIAGTQRFYVTGGSGNMVFDLLQASGDMIFQTKAVPVERLRIKTGGDVLVSGRLAMGAANLAANGAVATVLTAIGPVGASTTVQEWMLVKGTGGVDRWIPMF